MYLHLLSRFVYFNECHFFPLLIFKFLFFFFTHLKSLNSLFHPHLAASIQLELPQLTVIKLHYIYGSSTFPSFLLQWEK